MELLVQQRIQSLIVEGGRELLQSFIDADLWDEARVFTGKKYFGRGVKAPDLPFVPYRVEEMAGDILVFFSRQSTVDSR